MLLGLGTVFGGKDDGGQKLVWVQSGSRSPADAALITALAERGTAVDSVSPTDAETRWSSGKLPALLEGRDGRYSLRINSHRVGQAMQTEATVQEAFLVAQARAQGLADPARVPVVMSSPLLLLVGAAAFGIHNQGSYLSLSLVQILGAACFISLGYLPASFAQTPEVYSGLANLTFLPLMLLSGVYFSLQGAPAWLQGLADLLPLTPLLRVLRAIFNDGAGLASEWRGIAIVAAWTAVLFALASRRFKWVQEPAARRSARTPETGFRRRAKKRCCAL
jgi:hypothetical protein